MRKIDAHSILYLISINNFEVVCIDDFWIRIRIVVLNAKLDDHAHNVVFLNRMLDGDLEYWLKNHFPHTLNAKNDAKSFLYLISN